MNTSDPGPVDPNAELPMLRLDSNRSRRLLLACAMALPVLAAPTLAHAFPPASADDGPAMSAFKDKHDAIVKLVKKKASSKKLEGEIDGLLDYDWIAKAALGGSKKYDEACGAKCGEFDDLLTKLIRENYLRMIRKAASHPVEYVSEVSGKRGAYKVTTKVKIKKNGRDQVVEVAYVMHQIDGKWQVRDIITDSVSLAKTYRYEFNKTLKAKGIEGVLANLQRKIDELG